MKYNINNDLDQLRSNLKLIISENIEQLSSIDSKMKKIKAINLLKQVLVQQIQSQCEIIKLKIQKDINKQSYNQQYKKSISVPEEERSDFMNTSQDKLQNDQFEESLLREEAPIQKKKYFQSQNLPNFTYSNYKLNREQNHVQNYKPTFQQNINQNYSSSQLITSISKTDEQQEEQSIIFYQKYHQNESIENKEEIQNQINKEYDKQQDISESNQTLNETIEEDIKRQIKKKFLSKYNKSKQNQSLLADQLSQEYNLQFRTVCRFIGTLIQEIETQYQKPQKLTIKRSRKSMRKAQSQDTYNNQDADFEIFQDSKK